MKKVFLIIIILQFISCGGGGGSEDYDSLISGTWDGELIRGITPCSDGNAVGLGAGTSDGPIKLEVTGSDVIDSKVVAKDGTCTFEGLRTATGFTARAIDNCSPGYVMLFRILEEENAARVAYDFDFTSVPALKPDGQPVCATTGVADIYR